MAETGNNWVAYVNNRIEISFATLLDDGGVELDLSNRVVRFSCCLYRNSGVPNYGSPTLAFLSSDAAPGGETNPQVYIENVVTGDPRVVVTLLASDTASLPQNSTTVLHCQMEVTESDGSSPVVVATGTLTLRPNITDG